jgi:hypothetical protein
MATKYEYYRALHPRWKWLYVGVGISVLAHVMIFGGYSLIGEKVKEVVHRITFEPPPPPPVFWKPPRTEVRALEFRKRPIPRGVLLEQQRRIAKTRVSDVQALAAMRTESLLNRLDASQIAPPSLRRTARMGVGSGLAESTGGGMSIPVPKLSGVTVRGVKETSQQVDMRLDMLSVKDMDTGQYQAMVIQDPDDRRKVSGYIHLAQVFTRSRTVRISVGYGGEERGQSTTYQSLDYLIKALQEYTGIEADYLGPVPLDDPRLRAVPWLLLPSWFGESHAHSEGEIANLGQYLAEGGFVITISGHNEKMKGARFAALRSAMLSQGLNEGADWRFVYLKPSHPLYHSFFDFDMAVRDNSSRVEIGDMGLVIGERLAVFLSAARRISTQNATPAQRENNVEVVDGTRHLQFTVNTVVFALTQEGGVTQQLMDGLR